ncbi:MAG: diacylglycerol kinase [Spirochaetaceae bacterium]|nr:diacylglycerol kinase [Spirochaetaceae bacterium]
MVFEEFSFLLSQICSRSCVAVGRPLVWAIVVNPCAGGFTIRSRWKKHYSQLLECVSKAEKNPLREGRNTNAQGLFFTKAVGSAGEITNAILKEAETYSGSPTEDQRPFYLIICAGGDGTSRDIMTSLYHASPKVRDNFAILRLPMGTGNDGSDTWELNDALDLLIEPSTLAQQRVLQLKTASNKGPFLAFNILSVGLDAFVTHMTNKTKGKLPGDSYKIWVDLAALFYDLIYKVGYMDVRAMDSKGKEVKTLKEKLLLLAVGESGKRTYGSHKWILPDERNVCAIKQMSLLRKLSLKNLFNHGGHVDKPEAILWNAVAVEFSTQYPLLAQMDGETVLLKEEDFPASIELSAPVIPILRKL